MTERLPLQAWELGDLPLHRLVAAGQRITEERCRHSVRIAVLGDAATQHYCQALSAALKLRGWWPIIYEAEFETIRQEILDPGSGLYASQPQFVILFTTAQALAARFAGTLNKIEFAESCIAELIFLWDQIVSRLPSTIIQHTFAGPVERPYGNQTIAHADTFASATNRINARLFELATPRAVRLVDTEFQASYYGKHRWFDERLWCLARQALSPTFLPPLAKAVSDTVLAEMGVAVKCVIVDLDNTLWGGILSDDGPERIEIGNTEVGLAFLRFQQFLANLRDRGVLLAICSKNHEDVVLNVLENHPDMVLRKDDFVAIVANYEDKASNIMRIRDQLNLGLDSFVFLDDSPFERDFIRQTLPEVQVPDLPDDPAGFVGALARLNIFEGRGGTAEDRARGNYYQTDAAREALRSKFTGLQAYLEDLRMEAEVRGFDAFTLPRVLQLVQRSNQFNLTTVRYSELELRMLAGAKDTRCFCIRLLDRLGDNGIVVVIVLRKYADDLIVDTWIMSCRVLGRGVEAVTLQLIVDCAIKLGCRRVVGRYVPTAKNGLVAGLYPQLGFTALRQDDAAQLYELDVQRFEPGDHSIHLRVSENEESA